MRIEVRVRPRSGRVHVGGSHDGALVVDVSARAVDSKATDAMLEALAGAFEVPRTDVELLSGRTSQTKVVEVRGADPARLAELLAARPL